LGPGGGGRARFASAVRRARVLGKHHKKVAGVPRLGKYKSDFGIDGTPLNCPTPVLRWGSTIHCVHDAFLGRSVLGDSAFSLRVSCLCLEIIQFCKYGFGVAPHVSHVPDASQSPQVPVNKACTLWGGKRTGVQVRKG